MESMVMENKKIKKQIILNYDFLFQNLVFRFSLMEEEKQNLISRPPVVVILGHVDHGKTSLLNAIRKIQFTEEKPGGVITQHIGAFEIEKNEKKITFLDTPGHEAFSQMRSRGAKVADIAILVVAADEGVKPQTKEAILHVKKSNIPLIVAINKIDKALADPQKVKRELQKEEILVEDFGGKIPSVNISAKTGQGINDLLELILILAEMEDLKADISKPAEGVIIESYLDSKRGPLATIILNQGKLEPGQIIGTNSAFGKIRNLEDSQGNLLSSVLPSQPAVVLGFENVPRIGEKFKTFTSLEEAKANLKIDEKSKSEVIFFEPNQKVLNLIIKTDVLGSLEAIEEILKNFPPDKVFLRILKGEVGEITESDVKLAVQAKAKILGFRVKVNYVAERLAEREKIKIMRFEIIYDLVEGVRKMINKILEPEITRVDLGKIKALIVFLTEKNRQIIGGKVIEGEIRKRSFIEIQRDKEIIGKGKLINLQRDKKDIEIAKKGEEVGILYEGEIKIEAGDILIIYTEERKKTEL